MYYERIMNTLQLCWKVLIKGNNILLLLNNYQFLLNATLFKTFTKYTLFWLKTSRLLFVKKVRIFCIT